MEVNFQLMTGTMTMLILIVPRLEEELGGNSFFAGLAYQKPAQNGFEQLLLNLS